MTLRILEPALLSIFLIATAFFAADMVNTVGKRSMQTFPSFTVPERVKKPAVSSVQSSETEEAKQSGISEPLPPVKLIGTVTGAHPYAIILDPSSNRQEIYRLKDIIGNDWVFYRIETNRAVLKKYEKTETLEVKFIEPAPGSAPEVTSTGIKPAAAGSNVKLDPREVEAALSDLNKVMTQARVVPNMMNGKTVGYRIFNIVPDSIYAKIGIVNSDIIERVNGVEIKGPDTLYHLFQQIKSENRITLDLTRAGKRESIKIEIR